MTNNRWFRIALALGMVMLANANSYYNKCDTIRDQLKNDKPVERDSDIDGCIFDCFYETTGYRYGVTPEKCFSDFVKPGVNKLFGRRPTQHDVEKCTIAKRRVNCKYPLIFHFSKWFKRIYKADHEKRFAKLLFFTWALNPSLRLIPRLDKYSWEHDLAKMLSEIKFHSDDDISAALNITSPSDPSQFPKFRREIRRHCYKPVDHAHINQYCRIRPIMTIANKIQLLAKGKQQYGSDFQKYVTAIKSNFVTFSVLLEPNFANDINPPTEREKTSILDQQLNELADLAQGGNTQKIHTFLQFMPEPYLLQQACKKSGAFPNVAQRCCVLENVVKQLLIYSEMKEKRKSTSGKKAVTINFSLNLRAVITELRGEEIFKMMLNNRYEAVTRQEETAKLIEGKFGQLKNYFSKLQSFNMQKARADVGYVKGRLEYYEGRTKAALGNVSEQVGTVLHAAFVAQGLELAEKGVKLAFAMLEACNPFKTIFNGGTATDILDAAAEVSEALRGLVHATTLKEKWTDVIGLITSINEGFQKNSEFLYAVGRIVDKIKLIDFPNDDEFEECKSTFLRLYNDYTPQVDREQFGILTTKLDDTVDAGCELIDGVTGAASNGYIIAAKQNGYCEKAKISTNRLQTIFEEIYDFQFEFIESMASYLQSSTGYHASQQMITLTSKPMTQTGDEDRRRSELRADIIMAHTTYEMQKRGAIQNLCDFLEYKEGGKTPTVCQGSTIDMPTLLSYIPKRCRSFNTYVSIPIATSEPVHPGQINVTLLYSGEEVSFDIPSYDWMKQHKWIGHDDNFEAIYFRSFEVFLPTITREEKKIEVRVRSMGGNKFQDENTEYSIIPSESFTTVYTGGDQYYPCSGNKIENPYSICEDRQLPKLCIMSEVHDIDDERRLYQTSFARFKIKAKGISTGQTPEPHTPLDIKAKVNMCVFQRDSSGEKRSSVVGQKPGCCTDNNYWNKERRACESCSDGSTSNLNGYYCENNRNALSPGA